MTAPAGVNGRLLSRCVEFRAKTVWRRNGGSSQGWHPMYASRKIGTLQETIALLNCRRLPARLNVTEAAVILGFQEHDMPVLIARKCLSPLGKPAPNSPTYFAAVEISAMAEDRDWLDRATRMLSNYWALKNSRKKGSNTSRGIARENPTPRRRLVSVRRSRQSPGESADRGRESEAGLL